MITIDTASTGIAFRANDTGNVHVVLFNTTADQAQWAAETLPTIGTRLGTVIVLSANQYRYDFTRRGQNFARMFTTLDSLTEAAKAIAELPR